ncbi:hypothetical protein VB005_00005 [Metarhizium brunneum]
MSTGSDVVEVTGAQPRSTSPERLLFMNSSNPSEFSQAFSRKKARSHIMNRYHRRIRQFRTPSTSKQVLDKDEVQSEEAKSLPGLTRRFPIGVVGLPIRQLLPLRLDLVSRIGIGNSAQDVCVSKQNSTLISQKLPDPSRCGLFNNLQFPFPLNRRDEDLLFHYGTVFNYTNMPVNMKTDWFEFASTDDALLHAFLIMSALHICILRGRTSSVDAFRHQTKLVKVLNDRLSHPILSCLDSTILVISCLALIEILNASPLAAAAHIEALGQLITRRGGLMNLGLNGTVRRKALWADLGNSIAQQIKPRFPYSSDISPITLPPDSIQPTVDTSPGSIYAELSNLEAQASGPSDLCAIIRDLQYLCLVINSANRTDITQIDRLVLSDHFYDVERRAYDLLLTQDVYSHNGLLSVAMHDALTDLSSALYMGCCLAAIIYSCLALREIPPQAGVFNQLVTNLARVAQKIDVSQAYCRYPKTLLWVLGTGGAAARGRTERMQFVKLLDHLLQEPWMHNCDAMRDEVQYAIHITPVYLAALMDFWDDVEEMRNMRDVC